MHLVPLKVRIGLKQQKRRQIHAYPDFNSLDAELRDGLDWCHFVDQYGGWHYDQIAGHADHDDESPRGTWFGMLLVPEAFALAAVAKFPDQVEILDETEAERFYEQRAHVNEPAVHEDVQVLQAIAAKRALGVKEDEHDRRALDVNHSSSGRRVNKKKTWDGFKQACGIEIHPGCRKGAKHGERLSDRSDLGLAAQGDALRGLETAEGPAPHDPA